MISHVVRLVPDYVPLNRESPQLSRSGGPLNVAVAHGDGQMGAETTRGDEENRAIHGNAKLDDRLTTIRTANYPIIAEPIYPERSEDREMRSAIVHRRGSIFKDRGCFNAFPRLKIVSRGETG